jgi:flavin-dependent dehydrogenase
VTERSRIVIGADGQHSLVARTVEAPAYNQRPALTCAYYSYWSGVRCDGTEVWIRDRPLFIVAFPTNFGLTCVAAQVPVSEFSRYRADIGGYFMSALGLAPSIAERVRAGRREERFLGTADLPNFFRKPYGPGWALVGDAGYHKDPITARGISDAFRDAELLAEAIDAGFSGRRPLDASLAWYERRRNEMALPEYEQTCVAAAFTPIPADVFAQRAALCNAQ